MKQITFWNIGDKALHIANTVQSRIDISVAENGLVSTQRKEPGTRVSEDVSEAVFITPTCGPGVLSSSYDASNPCIRA